MKQKENERSEESEWTVAAVRPVAQENLSQFKAAKEGQGRVLDFAITKWGADPVRALTWFCQPWLLRMLTVDVSSY